MRLQQARPRHRRVGRNLQTYYVLGQSHQQRGIPVWFHVAYFGGLVLLVALAIVFERGMGS